MAKGTVEGHYNMQNRIKLIIFDWDDVITLGSKEGYFACYHEALGNRLGKKISWENAKDDILATWGATARDAISAILKKYPKDIKQVLDSYQKCILGKTFSDHLSVVPGIQETLRKLSRKYILCVTTGMHPETLHKYVMPKFKIPDVFSDIISGYEIKDPALRKPNPYTANLFMKKHDVLPQEAVMVGDAKNDIKMAWAAGITPIAVLTGHLTAKDAEELGLKYVILNVTHLPGVLEKMGN